MLGVDFEVHEPPELIEHLRALAGRLERATMSGVGEPLAATLTTRPYPAPP
jgi:hypothetical protein